MQSSNLTKPRTGPSPEHLETADAGLRALAYPSRSWNALHSTRLRGSFVGIGTPTDDTST